MTAAERLMTRGQARAESDWSTTGSFTIEGYSQTWSGVVSDEDILQTLALGGTVTDRALLITASRAQFETANVTPRFGDSVIYNGQRWIIEGQPGVNSDMTSYTLRCVGTMNNRRR